MVVKSLPTHDVSAMGRKFEGTDGSSCAACFPSNFTEAVFHCSGTTDCTQHALYMLWRAVSSAGHLLKTTYGTPSSGQGADLLLDLLTASSNVMALQLKSSLGGDGEGNHAGAEKVFGSAW